MLQGRVLQRAVDRGTVRTCDKRWAPRLQPDIVILCLRIAFQSVRGLCT